MENKRAIIVVRIYAEDRSDQDIYPVLKKHGDALLEELKTLGLKASPDKVDIMIHPVTGFSGYDSKGDRGSVAQQARAPGS